MSTDGGDDGGAEHGNGKERTCHEKNYFYTGEISPVS